MKEIIKVYTFGLENYLERKGAKHLCVDLPRSITMFSLFAPKKDQPNHSWSDSSSTHWTHLQISTRRGAVVHQVILELTAFHRIDRDTSLVPAGISHEIVSGVLWCMESLWLNMCGSYQRELGKQTCGRNFATPVWK